MTLPNHKRIAMFLALGTLETLISVRDGVKLLAAHGYRVDIYILRNPSYPEPDMGNELISVIDDRPYIFRSGSLPLPEWSFGRGLRLYHWIVFKLLGYFWRRFFFRKELIKKNSEVPYHCFIGMDPEGLSVAALCAQYLKVPHIYWSLELRFSHQTLTRQLMDLKEEEIRDSRQAAFSIIQDEWRAKALAEENGLTNRKMLIVPNAGMGEERTGESSYLNDRWGISMDKKIVLCAGTFAPWAMSREICEAAVQWPDEYILVMHSRRARTDSESEYMASMLQKADPAHVIISFDQLNSLQYQKLVASADIGIAFYNSYSPWSATKEDRNMKIMGLSSGKVADYLQYGIPVIVNDGVIGPKELIEEYQCGLSVGGAGDIAAALQGIADDYDRYSANARRCFVDRLELSKNFSKVIEEIDRLEELDLT